MIRAILWVWRWFLYWVKQNLISLDQLANTLLLFGDARETISARAWRLRKHPVWGKVRIVIDAIFFFDPNHCRESFRGELRVVQFFPWIKKMIRKWKAKARPEQE